MMNITNTDIAKSSIVSVVDSTGEAVVISSMEEFYQFITEKANIVSIRDTFPEYPIMPNASVSKETVEGYTIAFKIFEGCKDLEISFSDYQTADKLGLIAHKTYFVTIGQIQYDFQLQSNWRASIAESPECGLILEDPRTDDFVNAPRGYRGFYDAKYSLFMMTTQLVYFLDYTDDPKIWYPCAPEKVKWNINVLKM